MKIKRILKWTAAVVFLGLFAWFFIAYWTSSNDCDRKTAAPNNPMKAIVYCDYGLPNLKLQEIEKPTPADDQLLVRVRAASVNPYDWHFVEGTPKIMRLMGVGLRKPKDTRLGVDFAGTVEAVGKNVTQFKPGDDVSAEEEVPLPSTFVHARIEPSRSSRQTSHLSKRLQSTSRASRRCRRFVIKETFSPGRRS